MAEEEIGSLVVKLRADLTDLQNDVRKMQQTFEGGFSSITSSAVNVGRQIAGSLGIAFSVGAVVNYTKGIVNLGGRLTDLSQQVGISAQTLSGLKNTLEENGSSIEGFATAVFMAQRNLGNINKDTDEAAQALKRLGLDYKDLRDLSTEDFMGKLIEGLSGVANQSERASIGATLLNRQYRILAPALEAMAGRVAELRASGISEKDIKILDDMGDAWTRVGNQVAVATAKFIAMNSVDLGTTIGGIVKAIDRLNNVFDQGIPLIDFFNRRLLNTQRELLGLGELLLKIARLAPLAFEKLTFGKIDFNSKLWADMAADLKNARESLGAGNLEADWDAVYSSVDASGKKFKGVSAEAAKAIESLTKSLEGQITGLKAQQVALTEGESAGLRYKLTQEAIAEVGKNIPGNIKKQIDQIIALTNAVAVLTLMENARAASLAARVAEDKKGVDAMAEALDMMRQIQNEGLNPQQKELAAVAQYWDDLAKKFQDVANAAGLPIPIIEDLLQQIRLLREAKLFELDPRVQEHIRQLAQDEQDAVDSVNALNEAAGKSARINEDLRKTVIGLAKETAIFGMSFDALTAEINATAEALRTMSRGPEWDELKIKFDSLTAQKNMRNSFREIVDSLSRGIEETVTGIMRGEQTMSDGMRNMFRNVLLGVQESLFDKTIMGPLKGLLNAFFDGFSAQFNIVADESAQRMAKSFGESFGRWLRETLQNLSLGGISFDWLTNLLGGGLPKTEKLGAGQITESLAGDVAEGVTGAAEEAPLLAAAAALTTAGVSLDTSALGLGAAGFAMNLAATSLTTAGAVSLTGAALALSESAVALTTAAGTLGGSSGGSSLFGSIGKWFMGGGGLKGGFIDASKPFAGLPRYESGGAVPIVAHSGEFILRKAAVDAIGVSALAEMNRSLKLPRMQWGGFISPTAFTVPEFQNGGAVFKSRDPSHPSFVANVQVMGDILAKAPWTTKDDVIRLTMADASNRGPHTQLLEKRLQMKR